MKIILIENDKDHRILIRSLLAQTKIDIELEEFESGELAIDRIAQTNFDCIFLDYLLSDIPGIEMIKRVKAVKPNIPIISITGFSNGLVKEEMITLGVQRVISKDKISKEALANALQSILKPESDLSNSVPDLKFDTPRGQLKEKEYSVLYVEDNKINIEIVRQTLLTRPDVEFIFALDASSGIELAKSLLPDIVLMDINLPDMSGFEAMRSLRENKSTQNIVILAVSANALAEDIKEALAAGFDDYICKPFLLSEFLKKVDHFLKKSRS